MSSRPPDGPLSSPRLRRSTREAADKSARAESRHARRTPIFAQSPYNVNPGSKLGPPPITGGPFTIGTDESTCGVTGHAVIVHKGCPSDRDDPCDPGVRIGCCVLA